MNTRLQRPIVLQQTGSWCALFNEVNYIIAGINLAVVLSTKSLLTCKSATTFDTRLINMCQTEQPGKGSAVVQLCLYHVGYTTGEINLVKWPWRSRTLGWTLGFFCVVVVKEAAGIAMGCLRGVCDHQQDPDRDEGEYLTC